MWKTVTLRTLVDRNVKWCSHWKTVWRFLRKLLIEFLYNPAIVHLGISPQELKKTETQIYTYRMFGKDASGRMQR